MVIFDLVQEELTLGVVLAACHLASSSHERSKRTDARRLWYKIYVFRDNDGQTMKAVFSAPPKCQRGRGVKAVLIVLLLVSSLPAPRQEKQVPQPHQDTQHAAELLTCHPLQRDLLRASILVVGQDVLWLQVEKSILHKKLLTKTYFWVRHLIWWKKENPSFSVFLTHSECLRKIMRHLLIDRLL